MASSVPAQCKGIAGSSSSFATSPVFGGRGRVDGSKQRYPPKRQIQVVAMAAQKKVNNYDKNWSKQWFGAGYFNEGTQVEPVNVVKTLEKKKLLSQVEKAGLLSKAESAGFSLSKIEKFGLLSKAEDLGLLSLAENFASQSPAALASLSLPLLVAALATIILVPDDSSLLVITQNVVASLFAIAAGGLFVSSIILNGLQEE